VSDVEIPSRQPAEATPSAFIEAFNSRLRKECLNVLSLLAYIRQYK